MDQDKKNVQVADASDVEQNKVIAALAYLLFFIPLLAAPNSKFAKYHANQGLILFILWVICMVVGVIPFIGLLSCLLIIPCFILMVLGIMNAVNGKMEPLPVVGNFEIIK